MTVDVSILFKPVKVGDLTLKTSIVLAPLTRRRANKEHVHTDLAVKYYSQRASYPGTLLISEGTFIAAKAGGSTNVPGIWSDEQIAAWKKVRHFTLVKKKDFSLQAWLTLIGYGCRS